LFRFSLDLAFFFEPSAFNSPLNLPFLLLAPYSGFSRACCEKSGSIYPEFFFHPRSDGKGEV